MVRRIATFFLFAIVTCASSGVHAEEAVPAVYQRSREVEFVNHGGWQGDPRGWGHWGGGFYNPWLGPQFFAGTWYQRPYPDHLIYNNVRSGMSGVPGSIVAGPVAPNCPCVETPVQ